MTLLLIQYNNYYNRIVKKEENLSDYITGRNFKFIERQNFNPNDNVNTEHIINWSEGWTPDYCIIVDENNEIVSRWFITESSRTRGMQYRISLYRDVIVDYYENVVNAPCFVEKGEVSLDNPLIFNKEDFFSNQIKKNESLLFDATKMSWLILYYNLSKKGDLKGTNVPINPLDYEDIGTTAAEWYSDVQANGLKVPTNKQFKMILNQATSLVPLGRQYRYLFSKDCNLLKYEGKNTTQSGLTYTKNYTPDGCGKALERELLLSSSAIKTAFDSSFEPVSSFNDISYYNGKIIHDTAGNYYEVSFVPDTTRSGDVEINYMTSGTLFDAISGAFKIGSSFKDGWSGNFTNAIQSRITYQYYKLVLSPIYNTSETFSFDFSGIKDITDQPYGIIALPYKGKDDGKLAWYKVGQTGYMDERVPMAILRHLTSTGVGASNIIYDAQILPYCPITTARSTQTYDNSQISLMLNELETNQYSIIYNNVEGTEVAVSLTVALFPDKAKFTKNLIKVIDVPTDNKEFKVNAQCDFYRLCSPNYNGIYEFSSELNNGIKYFNIDCTYKPYQPYIHVNPDFKGLYGTDFNDPRGLICGGDFSVTIISNAWETYKLQNKNYQEIFNRQIENLEVNNSIAMTQAKWGVAGGSVGGAGAGAIAGAKFGPYGAAAGAVIGGGASLAGGIADIGLIKKSQAEQLDYYTDVHNMNLQNIRALPDSLTKVDAFNNNNKIFPVLEYYSCTDAEKAVFRNKLTYEGMTVNAIGTIADYIGINQTFIKGQIIRLENLDEDNHMATTIYAEIAKGVYF